MYRFHPNVLALLPAMVLACGEGDSTSVIAAPLETPNPSEVQGGDGAAAASPGAVMLATMVRSPEGRQAYMGVFPELPRADVDTRTMIELPDVNIFVHEGSIYAWEYESARFRRFEVDANLRLEEGPSVSFQALGATGFNETRFISRQRAYSLDFDSLQIVVWNPELMEIVGSIDASALSSKGALRPEFGSAASFGDYVVWPVLWANYDARAFHPSQGVMFARAGSDEPAFIIEDERCGGGLSLHTDAAGDLYVVGNSYFGFGEFFSQSPTDLPPPCVLRVKAGTAEFDPDFYVDLARASGSPAIYQTWRLADQRLVAATWDSAIDPSLLASPDDYWTSPLSRRLILIDGERSVAVSGIPSSAVWNAGEYRLDGQLLMTGYDITDEATNAGNTTVYAIDANGTARDILRVTGELWAVGRVR